MKFELLSEPTSVEVIAHGDEIRDLVYLQHYYGRGDWWKLKGIARIRLKTGIVRLAELHWYEASGIGQVRLRFKRFAD